MIISIYTDDKLKGISDKDIFIYSLCLAVILLAVSLIIFAIEYRILSKIDDKRIEELEKDYYIECSKDVKEKITNKYQYFDKNYIRVCLLNMISWKVFEDFVVIAIIGTVVFWGFMFYKSKEFFEIVYKSKACLLRILETSIPMIVQIIYILDINNIINLHISDAVRINGLCFVILIPFVLLYVRLSNLDKRMRANID